MKKRKISAVINKRFKKTEVLFREITGRFEIESIHDFRTEIKKLRAFFRLLNVEIDDSELKISKEMKTFYGYAGTIRNLQLQLNNMLEYSGNPQYAVAEIYIEYLKRIIEKWEANVIELKESRSNFYREGKKIIKHLPGKFKKVLIKIFLQNKMKELASLVRDLPDDDILHSIRKLLKDISYDWAFIKRHKKLLPSFLSEEEKIKSFTELVGLFLDKGIAINLLETYYKDCEENGLFIEKDIKELREIESRWKKEKEELAQTIYSQPGLLQVSAVRL